MLSGILINNTTRQKMKTGKNLKDFRTHKINDLCLKLEKRMRWKKVDGRKIQVRGTNPETGDVMEFTIAEDDDGTYVDMSEYYRVYKATAKDIYALSPMAGAVFNHLVHEMDQYNKVIFNYYKDYKKLGYACYMPCYNGLIELLNKEFIIKADEKHTYWVSPLYVSRRNRMDLYYQYKLQATKKRTEEVMSGNIVHYNLNPFQDLLDTME